MPDKNTSANGKDANGNVDPKGWAGKHVAREGRHEAPKKGKHGDK